ncbi:hypothetical protein D9M71_569820 [compost metagenome]
MPVDAAALLLDGGFQLREEALVVDQPLAAHTFLPLLDPLLLIIEAIALQIGELALRLEHLRLHLAELASGFLLGLDGHVDDGGQAFSAARHCTYHMNDGYRCAQPILQV